MFPGLLLYIVEFGLSNPHPKMVNLHGSFSEETFFLLHEIGNKQIKAWDTVYKCFQLAGPY